MCWVIAKDNKGNRHTPPCKTTNEYGEFVMDTVPHVLGNENADTTYIFEVYALQKVTSDGAEKKLTGRDTLTLSKQGRVRWIKISPGKLAFIAVIFVVSVIVGIWETPYLKTKYYILVGLSFALAFVMLAYITIALEL